MPDLQRIAALAFASTACVLSGCGADPAGSEGGGAAPGSGEGGAAASASSTGGAEANAGGAATGAAGGEGGATSGGAQGGRGPCPCFDGPGTYCAASVVAHATQNGCQVPAADAHPDDVLSCHQGEWRWDTTCAGACNADGGGADACGKAVYQLPWKCGVEKLCTAVNNEVSHHNGISKYAFDFKFAVGNGVRAARGGKVQLMRFETGPGDDCYNGCNQSAEVCKSLCGPKANVISIRHADGSVAQYAHLSAPADDLEEEHWVEQGQLIAESGNTGWSTGPHLHFMVMEPGCKTTCQSIPIAFFEIGKPEKYGTYESMNCP
jgi:hypothetical protein